MERIMPEVQPHTYIVKPNDTLSSIAMKTMGTSNYYALWDNNFDLIGNDSNNIKAGMVLNIPGVSNGSESY